MRKSLLFAVVVVVVFCCCCCCFFWGGGGLNAIPPNSLEITFSLLKKKVVTGLGLFISVKK